MSIAKRLATLAWERFLAHRDEATLLAEIDGAPAWVDPCKLAYPEILSGVGDQRGLTFQHEHELVLFGVVMAEARRCAWLQPGPVDAEVLESENIAEWPLEPPRSRTGSHLETERLPSARFRPLLKRRPSRNTGLDRRSRS